MGIYDSETYQKDLDLAAEHAVGIGSLKGKSVLITGVTGTIGSFLADMLIRHSGGSGLGITVYAAGRDPKKLQERYGGFPEVKVLPYDMNRPIAFDVPVDYIIHGAGNAHPAAFNGDPVGTIMGNVAGAYALLEYGRGHGCRRFLYLSSGEVYGQGDLSLEEFEESYGGFVDPVLPRSCYPSSKRAAENLCVCYSGQFGLETVIARPCHTYGPQMTAADNRAHAQFIRNALKGEDIVLKSPGNQLRSYNYVADCASAVMTVLLKGTPKEAYNIANPKARLTIAQLAGVIAKTVGRKVVFASPDAADIAGRTPIAKQVLSSRKLEGLGWSGAYSIEKGIRHTIDILCGN